MQDTALYQYLLGLKSPWTVSRVNLDIKGQRVDVWADHPADASWECPQCSKKFPLYDHAEKRTWRHLDSCQFQTYLHANTSVGSDLVLCIVKSDSILDPHVQEAA